VRAGDKRLRSLCSGALVPGLMISWFLLPSPAAGKPPQPSSASSTLAPLQAPLVLPTEPAPSSTPALTSGQSLTRERLPAQAPAPRLNLNRLDDELPRPIAPVNDAQFARAVESLRAAATAAVLRSPSVREAAAGARAAVQDVREAQAARAPQLSLEVTSRYTEAAANSNAQSLRGTPYYIANASLPVYDFGRITAQVDSRLATSDAQDERLRGVYESVAGDTVLALVELARSRALLAATDRYLDRIGQLSKMITELIREDRGRSGELTQVQSRLLQALAARSAIESRLRETEISLARLLGDDAQAKSLIEAASTPAVMNAVLTMPALEPLLAGVARHPVIRQLVAEIEAQSQLAKSLASARLPQISVVAGRTPINPGATTQYLDFAGVTMNVPLYRGGGDVAAERSARERELSVRERRDQTERDLTARIRLSYQNATSQLSRADEYAQLLQISDRVRQDFYEQWSQVGRRSLFELLSAESEHHSLRLIWINSVYESLVSQMRMRAEAGSLTEWFSLPVKEIAR
jgi:adhesin transport system outer membrane protein